MKYLFIIYLGIFGFLFQPKVKVVKSVAYKWAGGRMESGVGTNYTFKIVTGKSSEKLSIDELWVDENYFKVKPQRQLENLTITNEFEKNDTVIIQANLRFLPDDSGDLKAVYKDTQQEKPFDYEGAALIGYKQKGKQKYIEVAEIKKLAKRNYQ